ncbi:hypothetical protein ACLK1T_29000 [Escherichia coli]
MSCWLCSVRRAYPAEDRQAYRDSLASVPARGLCEKCNDKLSAAVAIIGAGQVADKVHVSYTTPQQSGTGGCIDSRLAKAQALARIGNASVYGTIRRPCCWR